MLVFWEAFYLWRSVWVYSSALFSPMGRAPRRTAAPSFGFLQPAPESTSRRRRPSLEASASGRLVCGAHIRLEVETTSLWLMTAGYEPFRGMAGSRWRPQEYFSQ